MPKIAIIDDDASVGRAFHLLLTSAGLETVVFPTVGAFMESRKTVMCDCIITDLYMPVLSGFDLLERLHGQADCPPVIVVTAFNTSANRERAHRLGARGFFAKPIDDQALLDAIHWAIGEDDPENF
jgi:FixJ family two-component response regulator